MTQTRNDEAVLATAVRLALQAGWTMALLYGPIHPRPAGGPPELPSVHELPVAERATLEIGRMNHLLHHLGSLAEFGPPALPPRIGELGAPGSADYQAKVRQAHEAVLDALATGPPQIELAYQVGRSLRDTVNPPCGEGEPHAPAVAGQFARHRIAQIQEWLSTLATHLPPHAASIVGTSMGRWSQFAELTVARPADGLRSSSAQDKEQFAVQMCGYLLPQGDIWLNLLIGERPTSGLVSPEGYVGAAQLALRRSTRIIRRVVRHYWFPLATVAAALGGIMYLAITYLGGAAKVWTSIAAIAGSLGISAKGVAATVSRLAEEAERPVLGMAQEDVMAWAVTTLPPAKITSRGVRELRRSGIAGSSKLSMV